jgi:NADH-quinone oxidoreductase subunit L
MFRLYYMVFWGKEREYEHKPREASWVMTLPLVILAVFTCFSGFIPFSNFISTDNLSFAAHIDWTIATLGIAVAVTGICLATMLYKKHNTRPDEIAQKIGGFYKVTLNKFYMDEIWMFVTKNVIFKYISYPVAWFDKHIVDGMINQTGKQTENAAASIKGLQSGKVQFYAIVFVLGVLLITVLSLFIKL